MNTIEHEDEANYLSYIETLLNPRFHLIMINYCISSLLDRKRYYLSELGSILINESDNNFEDYDYCSYEYISSKLPSNLRVEDAKDVEDIMSKLYSIHIGYECLCALQN